MRGRIEEQLGLTILNMLDSPLDSFFNEPGVIVKTGSFRIGEIFLIVNNNVGISFNHFGEELLGSRLIKGAFHTSFHL